jgi:hypothetical protein
MFGLSASAADVISAPRRTPAAAGQNRFRISVYWRSVATARKLARCRASVNVFEALVGVEAMRTWLRSVVDAFLGKVPGKTSRLDTATLMAMDADFSDRSESTPPGNANIDLLEELARIGARGRYRQGQPVRRR